MRRFSPLLALVLVALCSLVGTGLAGGHARPKAAPTAHAAINPGHSISLGYRTLSHSCRRGRLPDRRCSPGAVFSAANKRMICVRGYSSKVRNVSTSLKNRVYAEYGVTHHSRSTYEVDHIVPLEGGGSNAIENLYPQPAYPKPGFHQKDKLENEMRSRICYRGANLRSTQRSIASNWVSLYNRWF